MHLVGYLAIQSEQKIFLVVQNSQMNFITKQGEKKILEFKYRGKSLSITYNYLWGPLAQKLLTITPNNIAPNTITMIGFTFSIIATIIFCLQLPFSSEAPRWTVFLFAFSVFTYHTLDNLDGKQARKIKNSSPLGMIMDHGCDALTVLTLSTGMSRLLCLDNQYLFIWSYLCVIMSFYMSAWCQYYSNGVMILGPVNGVDEGVPTIWILALITGIVGQQFWKTPFSVLGHTFFLNEVVIFCTAMSSLLQIYFIVTASGDQFTKDVKRALKDLVHAVLIIVTIFLIVFKTNIVQTHIIELALALSFTMSRTISYTLVCSVADMKFQQFQPSVLVFTLAYSGYALFLQDVMKAELVVYGVLAFVSIQYLVFVVNVVNHLAKVLQINVFKVYKPKQDISK